MNAATACPWVGSVWGALWRWRRVGIGEGKEEIALPILRKVAWQIDGADLFLPTGAGQAQAERL